MQISRLFLYSQVGGSLWRGPWRLALMSHGAMAPVKLGFRNARYVHIPKNTIILFDLDFRVPTSSRLQRHLSMRSRRTGGALFCRGQKKAPLEKERLKNKSRRRPTLPPRRQGSTIGAEELNFRVRDGNGCFLLAITTGNR